MRLVALALLLATTAEAQRAYPLALPRGCRDRSCVRGRAVQSSSPVVVVPNISNAITAGDKAGNWWALQTDGTMLASSSLTMSGQSSPGVSPLTFNGSTQYYKSGDVAFPASGQDFSVVAVFNRTNADSNIVSKWVSTSLTYICGVSSGNAVLFMESSGGSFQSARSVATVSVGTWTGICCSYNHASTGTELKVRYSSVTASGAGGGTFMAASKEHDVGGLNGGTGLFTGSSRGAFFTEKVLSDADCDRIVAGAM